MAGRDGRGPAGAGPGTGKGAGSCNRGTGSGNSSYERGFYRGSGRNGKGLCRQLSGYKTTSGVFYNKDNEIRELKLQAEIRESSLNKIKSQITGLEAEE